MSKKERHPMNEYNLTLLNDDGAMTLVTITDIGDGVASEIAEYLAATYEVSSPLDGDGGLP